MKTVHLVSLQVLKGFAMLLILLASPAALAHKPSDSYLSLQVTETAIHGQWDIALRDLDYALGLDDNQDGAITWGELRAQHAEIAAYALARLALSAGGDMLQVRDSRGNIGWIAADTIANVINAQ